jgi:hypothetical protein
MFLLIDLKLTLHISTLEGSSSGVLQIHKYPLRAETCSIDFKSINKVFVTLTAEHIKGLNIMFSCNSCHRMQTIKNTESRFNILLYMYLLFIFIFLWTSGKAKEIFKLVAVILCHTEIISMKVRLPLSDINNASLLLLACRKRGTYICLSYKNSLYFIPQIGLKQSKYILIVLALAYCYECGVVRDWV